MMVKLTILDFTSISQANVVCKQLGFIRSANFTVHSRFGPIRGNFSYNNVECSGNESTLDECPHSNVERCTASDGAGVQFTNNGNGFKKLDHGSISSTFFKQLMSG